MLYCKMHNTILKWPAMYSCMVGILCPSQRGYKIKNVRTGEQSILSSLLLYPQMHCSVLFYLLSTLDHSPLLLFIGQYT